MTSDCTIDPAIEARGIIKRFGSRKSLDGVDLTVARGSMLVLFGPNGAGKSTLLKILATLSLPTRGSLSILGVDALKEPGDVRGRLGYVSHQPMLYGDLTARENLDIFARLYGVENREAKIDELLEVVELTHRQHDTVRTFSRGMTQRVSIARALINDPELVFLDEPYSGLDPHAVYILDELLERVREDRTFVMVSHDLERGISLATDLMILAQGRVVYHEPRDCSGELTFRQIYHDVVGESGR